MSIRSDIEKCIRAAPDPGEAAKLVVGRLEMEGLSLGGIGWLGDDDEMDAAMEAACERWMAIRNG